MRPLIPRQANPNTFSGPYNAGLFRLKALASSPIESTSETSEPHLVLSGLGQKRVCNRNALRGIYHDQEQYLPTQRYDGRLLEMTTRTAERQIINQRLSLPNCTRQLGMLRA